MNFLDTHRPTDLRRLNGVLKHVLIILILFLMLYPLIWMAVSSLRPSSEAVTNASIIPDAFQWQNYVEGWTALGGVTFGRFLFNSLVIAFACIIGNLVACSLAAYAFARLEFRGRKVLFGIMLTTLMLPYHVQVIPQYILFSNIGWVDTFLPLIVPKLLATDAFFVFLMVQFMRGLPRDLDDAAKIDGAGYFQTYRRVIMPLMLPALATSAIFTFIYSWNDFFQPLLYLTSTENYTVSVALRLYSDAEAGTMYGPMFAMALVALGPVFGFFLVTQRYLVSGIATTGLK